MIITQTPFRMSFFGGGTDMESFFKEHGGSVLSTTFDKYCYVNVRHLPRFFDYSTELSYSKTERVTDINDIQHPAIRNAMKMLDIRRLQYHRLLRRILLFQNHSIPSINTLINSSSNPFITPTLRSASGQGERPGGSPGSRTLRGVARYRMKIVCEKMYKRINCKIEKELENNA